MRVQLIGIAAAVACCAAMVGAWAQAPAPGNAGRGATPAAGAVQELPPPPGALPIRPQGYARGGLLYTPPSTSPAPGGKSYNEYWSLAIQQDPNDLKVYREKNAQLGPPKPGEERVVFLGDSITEGWARGGLDQYFPNKPNYIGRGYTSETTQHMLVRFRPDVINLQPKVVVLLAGVNDIAGNSGAVPDETIHDNFQSMFDLAKVNNIKVVLVSTLPATRFFWQPGLEPKERIAALVAWEKQAAKKNGLYFVDAYTAMKDETNGMPANYSNDTVHPNQAGYQFLSGLVDVQIEKALKGEAPTY
jgi:lysophospholipase L1-like esterase